MGQTHTDSKSHRNSPLKQLLVSESFQHLLNMKASLHTAEMEVLVNFYIEDYSLAEYLILLDLGHPCWFSELIGRCFKFNHQR